MSKLQRATQLYQNEQYSEAKQLLLELINAGNHHCSLYEKVGDVSLLLSQYNDALNYYTQSIHTNASKSNAAVYVKLGDLNHAHLHSPDTAIQMYKTCIKLTPKNERCWFKYGKLCFKLRHFETAEQCYLKCVTPRACVKYHYALLLLSKPVLPPSRTSNLQKIMKLLQKCVKLKPNVFRYHFAYAKCLRDLNLCKKSEIQFRKCLALFESETVETALQINVYFEYSVLLSNFSNDFETALQYLSIAMDLDSEKIYKYVKDEYDHLRAFCKNKASEMQRTHVIDRSLYHPCLKLIVYAFEQTLTYNKIGQFNDANKARLMKKAQLVNFIFGGPDRIDRLHSHFQRIVNSEREIKLGIVSLQCKREVMIEMLGRVGLIKYFDKRDIEQSANNNIMCNIDHLCQKYAIDIGKEIVYVDNKQFNVNFVSEHCITYYVYGDHTILNALSMRHLKEIELIIGVYIKDEFDINLPKKALSHSLQSINRDVYWEIKKQIGEMKAGNIDDLEVIKRIRAKWKRKEYKQHFLHFAKVFKFVRKLPQRGTDWTMANILPLAVTLAGNDSEIQRRNAKALAFLGHYEEAERSFVKAIQYGRYYLNRMDYGYFLLKQGRFESGEVQFKQCLAEIDKITYSPCKVYVGYAKCLEGMNKRTNEIEKHYRLAIKACNAQYDDLGVIHYYLANFLFNQRKFKKSKREFENALQSRADSVNNHYGIAQCLLKLREFERYEFHLRKVIELDSTHMCARNDLKLFLAQKQPIQSGQSNTNNISYDYTENRVNEWDSDNGSSNSNAYNNGFIEEKMEKLDIAPVIKRGKSAFEEQFDRFWWDGVGRNDGEFNKYFDRFESNDLNDIQFILFNQNMERELREKIRVQSSEDMAFIMSAIEYIRNENDVFHTSLIENGLKNECFPLFAHHGIFTKDALMNVARSERDIEHLIRTFNNESPDGTVGNDKGLVQRIYRFVLTFHNQ